MKFCNVFTAMITSIFFMTLGSCKEEKKEEVKESFSLTDKMLTSTKTIDVKKNN
ncbi:hypothetical protein [Flavobacterium davisii]|uniref:hypothetical protein n=1 Tax=Flavobacterium davisii TaxID=2906077 RepID=UPI002869EC2F|nr:hypothetical protein [Flavobacterium davisii]